MNGKAAPAHASSTAASFACNPKGLIHTCIDMLSVGPHRGRRARTPTNKAKSPTLTRLRFVVANIVQARGGIVQHSKVMEKW